MEEQEFSSKKQRTKISRHLPNIITFLNLLFGLLASFLCVCSNSRSTRIIASVLILFSCFYDAFDGPLARKMDLTSEAGKQLDSFADIISFGISPMVLALSSLLAAKRHGFFYLLIFSVAIAYVSCGIVRLVRYNLSNFSGYFIGLPITAAGFILALHFLLANIFSYDQKALFLVLSVLLILSLTILMVSSIRVYRFPGGQ